MQKNPEGFLIEGDVSVASSSPGGILRSTSMEKLNHADGPLETPPLSRESPGFHGYHPSRSMSVQGELTITASFQLLTPFQDLTFHTLMTPVNSSINSSKYSLGRRTHPEASALDP